MDPKDYIVVIIIVVIAFAAGILSAYQYVESAKKEKDDKETANKLIAAQEKSLQASEAISIAQGIALKASLELKNAQQQTIIKTNELVEAQKKINELQDETLKKIMGFGYARINAGLAFENEFQLNVESRSDYPLYEASIVIYEQDLINKCPKIIHNGKPHIMEECFTKAGTVCDVVTINARKKHLLQYKRKLDGNKYLMIRIMTKHSTTIQYSIISSNVRNTMSAHYYRIFESKDGNYHFLEKDTLGMDDEIFRKNFSYEKEIQLLLY